MAQAAQRLEDAVGTTRGIRSQLQSHSGELMSNWSGTAASTFGRVFEEFDQDFNKVITAMQGMQENLVQTRSMYQQTEDQQQATVNKVAGILNNG
jgi:WXG100 family type VII secretion target